MYSGENAPQTPSISDLPSTDTVTYCGVTWRFRGKVPVGRFVTGDYYVVGPVTVVEIAPGWDGQKNGSVLNLPVDNAHQSGFDTRVRPDRYTPELTASVPVNPSCIR